MREYEGYIFDYKSLCIELFRVTKRGGICVWVVGDQTIDYDQTGTSFIQALYFKEQGWNLLDTMIYNKNSFRFPAAKHYPQTFEYMFIFSKGKPKTFNPIKDRINTQYNRELRSSLRNKKNGKSTVRHTGKKTSRFGIRYNIWNYVASHGNVTKDQFAYEHPAIFPEKLAEDHILSWSNIGDVILDPMCGSGTTLKMAWINHRDYIGIDCSPKYCDISRKRVQVPRLVKDQYIQESKQTQRQITFFIPTD